MIMFLNGHNTINVHGFFTDDTELIVQEGSCHLEILCFTEGFTMWDTQCYTNVLWDTDRVFVGLQCLFEVYVIWSRLLDWLQHFSCLDTNPQGEIFYNVIPIFIIAVACPTLSPCSRHWAFIYSVNPRVRLNRGEILWTLQMTVKFLIWTKNSTHR